MKNAKPEICPACNRVMQPEGQTYYCYTCGDLADNLTAAQTMPTATIKEALEKYSNDNHGKENLSYSDCTAVLNALFAAS